MCYFRLEWNMASNCMQSKVLVNYGALVVCVDEIIDDLDVEDGEE
jgi:hypothetical protein